MYMYCTHVVLLYSAHANSQKEKCPHLLIYGFISPPSFSRLEPSCHGDPSRSSVVDCRKLETYCRRSMPYIPCQWGHHGRLSDQCIHDGIGDGNHCKTTTVFRVEFVQKEHSPFHWPGERDTTLWLAQREHPPNTDTQLLIHTRRSLLRLPFHHRWPMSCSLAVPLFGCQGSRVEMAGPGQTVGPPSEGLAKYNALHSVNGAGWWRRWFDATRRHSRRRPLWKSPFRPIGAEGKLTLRNPATRDHSPAHTPAEPRHLLLEPKRAVLALPIRPPYSSPSVWIRLDDLDGQDGNNMRFVCMHGADLV